MRWIVFAMPLVLVLGGCGGSDVPNVADRYQEGIQEAWDYADQGGGAPTNKCALVVGSAVGLVGANDDNREDAVEAYEACYVDVHAHWVKRKIALADGEQSPCMALMTGLMTSRMSLGSFADDLDLEVEALDARIAEKIEADVQETCPDQADSILG